MADAGRRPVARAERTLVALDEAGRPKCLNLGRPAAPVRCAQAASTADAARQAPAELRKSIQRNRRPAAADRRGEASTILTHLDAELLGSGCRGARGARDRRVWGGDPRHARVRALRLRAPRRLLGASSWRGAGATAPSAWPGRGGTRSPRCRRTGDPEADPSSRRCARGAGGGRDRAACASPRATHEPWTSRPWEAVRRRTRHCRKRRRGGPPVCFDGIARDPRRRVRSADDLGAKLLRGVAVYWFAKRAGTSHEQRLARAPGMLRTSSSFGQLPRSPTQKGEERTTREATGTSTSCSAGARARTSICEAFRAWLCSSTSSARAGKGLDRVRGTSSAQRQAIGFANLLGAWARRRLAAVEPPGRLHAAAGLLVPGSLVTRQRLARRTLLLDSVRLLRKNSTRLQSDDGPRARRVRVPTWVGSGYRGRRRHQEYRAALRTAFTVGRGQQDKRSQPSSTTAPDDDDPPETSPHNTPWLAPSHDHLLPAPKRGQRPEGVGHREEVEPLALASPPLPRWLCGGRGGRATRPPSPKLFLTAQAGRPSAVRSTAEVRRPRASPRAKSASHEGPVGDTRCGHAPGQKIGDSPWDTADARADNSCRFASIRIGRVPPLQGLAKDRGCDDRPVPRDGRFAVDTHSITSNRQARLRLPVACYGGARPPYRDTPS